MFKGNLQETVRYLTESFDQVLEINKVGIKVVGVVETEAELPDPTTSTTLQYGDTFLVGTTSNYEMYVFTRPYGEITTASWLNIGNIGVQGPQGPQGETGPEGAAGAASKWYVFNSNPISTSGFQEGDVWMNGLTGDVFQLNTYNTTLTWTRVSNIIGPQGIQGQQGIQGIQGQQGERGERGPIGDPGNFIHIVGAVNSTSQLPTPASLQDVSAAYLVKNANNGYDLYIQVGPSIVESVWTNMGQLNVATYVTANDGEFQSTWDADTKQDKITDSSQIQAQKFSTAERSGYKSHMDYDGFVVIKDNVNQTYYNQGEIVNTNSESIATLSLPNTTGILATEGYVTGITGPMQTEISYLDSNKVDAVTSDEIVYATDDDGDPKTIKYSAYAQANTMALRGANGVLRVATPTDTAHAANKGYVDGLHYKNVISGSMFKKGYSRAMSSYVNDYNGFSATVSNDADPYTYCKIYLEAGNYKWSFTLDNSKFEYAAIRSHLFSPSFVTSINPGSSTSYSKDITIATSGWYEMGFEASPNVAAYTMVVRNLCLIKKNGTETSSSIPFVKYNGPIMFWENPNPASGFAAQNITGIGEDLFKYKYLMIEFRLGADLSCPLETMKFALNSKSSSFTIHSVDSDGTVGSRSITTNQYGTIGIGSGRAGSTANTNRCIPVRLWGTNE